MPVKPKITIASLIYRAPIMADWIFGALVEFTPQLWTGEAEFFFVANDPTDEVLEHLKDKGYRHYINYNPHLSNAELWRMGFGPPEYIRRVYRGYNYAIAAARGDIVVLMNSDHYCSPNWLENLVKRVTPNTIVTSQIVECRVTQFRESYLRDFGHPATGFDKDGFLQYAKSMSKDQTRPSGEYMPVAFLKSRAEEVDYYPEGNLAAEEFTLEATFRRGLTGDKHFFKKLAEKGVEHITSLDSIVYHLDEGEKRM